MCRIAAVDPSTVTGIAKDALEAVTVRYGFAPMMARTMAQSGAVVAGWAALSGTLASGVLGARSGALVALAVAQASTCDYCLAAHSAIGGMVGLTPHEKLEARHGRAADPKEAAIVRLALAIFETHGGISDDELAIARAASLTDAEICEVLAHVALNLFTNSFNRLADTDIDFPKVDGRLPGA